ncbi:MAG TPA: DEAD/DEAH box helicase, partial [Planctomycetota bacterium]|nr:DEAD/DEAH box helicase [Planctomycetota bacterium]
MFRRERAAATQECMGSDAGSGPTVAAALLPPSTPLRSVPGVGPVSASRLAAAGLHTVLDLLGLFPRRYRELRELEAPVVDAVGALVRIAGTVRGTRLAWLPGRRAMVTVEFAAKGGTPFSAAFFNQPWLRTAYKAGDQRVVEGTLEHRGRRFHLKLPKVLSREVEVAGEVQLRYPEVEGIAGARLLQWLAHCLDRVDWAQVRLPPLPAALVDLDDAAKALYLAMHRPAAIAAHERARTHFALREAVQLFRTVERARRQRCQRQADPFVVDAAIEARIRARIPFTLTHDQQAAVDELRRRLQGPSPMGLLLQGDVGTGKTAVAAWAALAVLAHGAQVAFLAPTELLAEQQHAELLRWLRGSEVEVLLLTAGQKEPERMALERALAAGGPQLVVGTHALLSERTAFARLGLVVVDEQHRFGVAQRMALVRKGRDPHVLVMTATPIPRTLALTLFGDLDVATLVQRPPGSRPVPARFRKAADWKRVLRSITRAVRRRGRVFVVCPAIGEDGEKGGALRMHGILAVDFRCGLVHGRMPAAERQQVLAAFRAGEFDVLVGTTVLEVGVDVPAATLMVVAAADKFGIATLHQLRGRVGRG